MSSPTTRSSRKRKKADRELAESTIIALGCPCLDCAVDVCEERHLNSVSECSDYLPPVRIVYRGRRRARAEVAL